MPGQVDGRGHALYTDNAAAAAFDTGMPSFVCWRTDTFGHLDAANHPQRPIQAGDRRHRANAAPLIDASDDRARLL